MGKAAQNFRVRGALASYVCYIAAVSTTTFLAFSAPSLVCKKIFHDMETSLYTRMG